MKKKIVVIVSIIFAILASWLLFSCFKENSNNVHMQIGKDKFRYTYWELFTGNKWKLYVNEHYVTYVTPFESCSSKKEMKEHLSNKQLIKCLYDEGNTRIYSLPLKEYESKNVIIYTLNGSKFYSFSDDIEKYTGEPELKQRLNQLYEKYPYAELIKREQESWE
jgi:hypothetical protein